MTVAQAAKTWDLVCSALHVSTAAADANERFLALLQYGELATVLMLVDPLLDLWGNRADLAYTKVADDDKKGAADRLSVDS